MGLSSSRLHGWDLIRKRERVAGRFWMYVVLHCILSRWDWSGDGGVGFSGRGGRLDRFWERGRE